jgi:hypothetical protein
MLGPYHGFNPTALFCFSGGLIPAETLYSGQILNPTGAPGEVDIRIIVLCETLLTRGSSTDTVAQVSRGTLQEMYDNGELYDERAITNIGQQYCVSWQILHELFHAAMPETGWVSHPQCACVWSLTCLHQCSDFSNLRNISIPI